jgi:hypothetical protein
MIIASKVAPSRHIACLMTASLRAQANRGALEADPLFELQAPMSAGHLPIERGSGATIAAS